MKCRDWLFGLPTFRSAACCFSPRFGPDDPPCVKAHQSIPADLHSNWPSGSRFSMRTIATAFQGARDTALFVLVVR